jgi:prophage DNA circulation protein
LEACNSLGTVTVSSILTEADNILIFIAPLGDGAAAIIEIADPAIAPAVMVAVAIYDKAIPVIEKYLSDWAAASAANQPGILAQLEAAITALQSDVQGILNSITGVGATLLAEISAITSSILGEVSALLKAILQLKAAGGTTTAMAGIASHPHRYARMAGPNARTSRNNLVAELRVPTNTNMDAPRTALANKLAALQLK